MRNLSKMTETVAKWRSRWDVAWAAVRDAVDDNAEGIARKELTRIQSSYGHAAKRLELAMEAE